MLTPCVKINTVHSVYAVSGSAFVTRSLFPDKKKYAKKRRRGAGSIESIAVESRHRANRSLTFFPAVLPFSLPHDVCIISG
jgi:hypothetical protein